MVSSIWFSRVLLSEHSVQDVASIKVANSNNLFEV